MRAKEDAAGERLEKALHAALKRQRKASGGDLTPYVVTTATACFLLDAVEMLGGDLEQAYELNRIAWVFGQVAAGLLEKLLDQQDEGETIQ